MSIHTITVNELYALVTKRDLPLIDVRTPEEYREGHLKGALLSPLGEMTFDKVETQLLHAGFKTPEAVYINCRMGVRSMNACALLAEHDKKTKWISLHGGLNAWIEAGYPIVR